MAFLDLIMVQVTKLFRNNFFVTEEEIKFDEKYVLKTDSNFKNSGTDGKDLGADISLICNILGC